jgi:hypothetical protein
MGKNINEDIVKIKKMMGLKEQESEESYPVKSVIIQYLNNVNPVDAVNVKDTIEYVKRLCEQYVPQDAQIPVSDIKNIYMDVINYKKPTSSNKLNTSQEKPEIDYESNKYNDSYEDLF